MITFNICTSTFPKNGYFGFVGTLFLRPKPLTHGAITYKLRIIVIVVPSCIVNNSGQKLLCVVLETHDAQVT